MVFDIKQQLKENAQAWKECDKLHQERIQCMQKIELHKQTLKEPQQKKEAIFYDLQQRLKQLDHAIDTLGDSHTETRDRLQQALIQKDPVYATIERDLQESCSHEESLLTQKNRLSPIHTLFVYWIDRPTQFLDFLPGRKTILRSRIMKQILDASKEIVDSIDTVEILQFLHVFIEEVEKPWNHALYHGHFEILCIRFNALMEALNDRYLDAVKQRHLLMQKKDAYLSI